jgi:hypothetical protein
MLFKKVGRPFIIGIMGLFILVGIGYLSNGISRTSCEGKALQIVSKDVGSRRVFILSNNWHPRLTKILSRFDFDYKRCPSGGDCFPNVAIDSPNIWRSPFVLSVRWGYATDPEGGMGKTTHFLCLFGFVVPIGEDLDWIA